MAGIIFQTSFDHYATTTHRFNSAAGVGPPTTTTVGAGRNSTAGLRFTNSTSALVARTLPTTPADIWFAFANRVATLPTGTNSRVIAELRNAGTRSIHVRVRADGTLGIYSGGTTGILNGTLLGNLSGFAMLTNTFYHFELYIRFS